MERIIKESSINHEKNELHLLVIKIKSKTQIEKKI